MLYVLVILFTHHGLLVDRSRMWVDPKRYDSYAGCEAAYQNKLAEYDEANQGLCIKAGHR